MSTFSRDEWLALSPFLDEALAMTEEERSSWLAALRSSSPRLASQLEALLHEHGALSVEGFLDVAIEPPAGLAGRKVGVYTLKSQIGQGGMGCVWLAERNDGRFERQVAVKFLNIALLGREGEERFKREGRILGFLVHPHIAELVDAGVSETGQPFLVLEYVNGAHIDVYSDRHRLTVEARIRLFLDVLQAVGHAHANLIVHRDLKRSNVLVRDDGQVKLLDFGIAKLLEVEERNVRCGLTSEGLRAMTPECAAPEQLLGGPITTATDVYGLGVLLYQLLTGQHPAGCGAHAAAELVKQIVEIDPQRPSDAVISSCACPDVLAQNAGGRGTTPHKLSRVLRGDLDTIVAKALKKCPEERYGSALSLADDLRHYLLQEPISARADTVLYRVSKFTHRHRTAVAMATLAVLATLAGMTGTLLQARKAHRQRDFAFRQLARAERINNLNELLVTDVAPLGKPLKVNELLDREAEIVNHEHYDDVANHVDLLISVGEQFSGEEENAKARRMFDEAYRLSRGIADASVRADASCALSWSLVVDGELGKAESLVEEGLRELPKEPQFGPERVFCLTRASEIAQRNGNSALAVARARFAEEALAESAVRSPVQELTVLTDLAGALGDAGKFREANAAFERASTQLNNVGYGETQKAVKLFNDWALILSYAGQPLEAERKYRRAIEISRRNQSEDAVSPILLYNYAGVLRDLGRLREAADYTERASEKARAAQDSILEGQTELQQARIYADRHEFDRANALLSDLEPKLRKILPPVHYAFASLASDRSLMAQAQGNEAEALRLANQAVALEEAAMQRGGECAANLPMLLVRRSNVELAQRRWSEAEVDATQATQLLRKAMEPGAVSSILGRAYLTQGRALQAEGKSEEAKVAFRSAVENLEGSLGSEHSDTRAARQSATVETQM